MNDCIITYLGIKFLEMKTGRPFLYFFLITISSNYLSGCEGKIGGKSSDPEAIILKYRELREANNLPEAYTMLTDSCRSMIEEEEFISKNEIPDSLLGLHEYTTLSIEALPVPGEVTDFARYKVNYRFIDKVKSDTTESSWYYTLYFEGEKWNIIWTSSLLDRAYSYLTNQQNEEAILIFRIIIGINPYNDLARRGLASALANENEYQEAIYQVKVALRIKPDDVESYVDLAELFRMVNQYDSSINYYQKAMSIRTEPIYHVNLGICYKLKEQYVEAEEQFRKSLEKDSLLAQAWWMLGELYSLNLKDPAMAIECYEAALRSRPMEVYYQNNLNYSYARVLGSQLFYDQGQLSPKEKQDMLRTARECLMTALETDPYNPEFQELLDQLNEDFKNL